MTSPIVSTKKALERRLSQLTPTLPIAYENVAFTPPAGMYLRVQFNIQPPDDPVFGKGYYRERLQFNIFVCEELNKGTSNAQTKAEAIRELFKKGTYLLEDTYSIHILTTPQIAGSVITIDRLIIPVLINVVTEVST